MKLHIDWKRKNRGMTNIWSIEWIIRRINTEKSMEILIKGDKTYNNKKRLEIRKKHAKNFKGNFKFL